MSGENIITKEEAKNNLKRIIEKYNRCKNSDALKDEANAEKIIEDIFENVLGWEALEDYIKRRSQRNRKIPDYTFRLNGINKFFLEAKKVSANLDDINFQKQAIGYARSSSVPFAVLTNFVEIRVYVVDREIDKFASFERFQLFKPILIENCINENEFEKLWLLSKESFVNKKIYSFAEEICKLPKRKEIDRQLSEKLDFLRKKLISNIKKNEKENNIIFSDANSKILLDEVVQKILDRLMFIRVCEDREYENRYLESFLNSYKEKKINLWDAIKELFRDYDTKNEKTGTGGYDSELFSNSLCDNIFIDDDILELIIKEFYYFEDGTPINFSKIPADVLGNLYESYLSHISRNIESQKSHRKEQGIYYTPTYIVDYIVRNTLGELLKKKKINVEKIRVLDPACGSGSFLIKAFDILDEYYVKHDKNYEQTKFDTAGHEVYTRKVEILKNNIFGVDLDKQAVEIAQLNLLLKIAEKGEQLPKLRNNIKNGNSLIDDPAIAGDKAFKWEDKFKEVMQEGGFDVVIGNPPYIFARSQKFSEKEKEYYYKNFSLVQYQLNTYILFIERAIKLLKPNGYFGFIIPNTWQTIDNFTKFRKYLFDNMSDITIINITDKVFTEANVDTSILIFKKNNTSNKKVKLLSFTEGKIEPFFEGKSDKFGTGYVVRFSKGSLEETNKIIKKIEINSLMLKELTVVRAGLKAYEVGKGTPKQTTEMKNKRIYHANKQIDKTYYKYLEGKDVCRYSLKWSGKFLKYGECLAAPRTFDLFNSERILVRQIPSKPPHSINAMYLNEIYLNDINSMIIYNSKKYPIKFILGLLNSKLISYWFNMKFNKLQRSLFPQFKVKELEQFPILKDANKTDIAKVITLVDKMLSLNRRLNEIGDKKTDERARVEEEIKKTDAEIDELVYKIYRITEEEKRIIEESLR